MTPYPDITSYLGLYTRYYDLERPYIEQDELDFYLWYAQRARGPILEPMCGTGRLLIPLIQAGHDMHGFDISTFMLKALTEKCTALNVIPRVWQQSIQELQVRNTYELVLIPDGSFCLITDTAAIVQSLHNIYTCLQPGGTFVMELQTPYFTPQEPGIWTSRVCECPDGSMIIAHNLNVSWIDNIGSSISRYELIDRLGRLITTEFERYQLRFYEPHEITALLNATGFQHIQLHKPYQMFTPPTHQNEFIIVEGRK